MSTDPNEAENFKELEGRISALSAAVAAHSIAPSVAHYHRALDLITSAIRLVNGDRKLSIAFVGAMKAGKSSTFNALLRAPIAPMATEATTAIPLLVAFDANISEYQLNALLPPDNSHDGEPVFSSFTKGPELGTGSPADVRGVIVRLTDLVRQKAAVVDRLSVSVEGEDEEARKKDLEAAEEELRKLPAMLLVTCPPTGMFETLPADNLERILLMDTPGAGELSSVIRLVAVKCLAESDVHMHVFPMDRLGTALDPELMTTGHTDCRTAEQKDRTMTTLVFNGKDKVTGGRVPEDQLAEAAQTAAKVMDLQHLPAYYAVSALYALKGACGKDGEGLLPENLTAREREMYLRLSGMDKLESHIKEELTNRLVPELLHCASADVAKALALLLHGAEQHRLEYCKSSEDLQALQKALQRKMKEAKTLVADVILPFIAEFRAAVAKLWAERSAAVEETIRQTSQYGTSSPMPSKTLEDAQAVAKTAVEATTKSQQTAAANSKKHIVASLQLLLKGTAARASGVLYQQLKTALSSQPDHAASDVDLESLQHKLSASEFMKHFVPVTERLVAARLVDEKVLSNLANQLVTRHAYLVDKQKIKKSVRYVSFNTFFFFRKTIHVPHMEIVDYQEEAVEFPVNLATLGDMVADIVLSLAKSTLEWCETEMTAAIGSLEAHLTAALLAPLEREIVRLENVLKEKAEGEAHVLAKVKELDSFIETIKEQQDLFFVVHLRPEQTEEAEEEAAA